MTRMVKVKTPRPREDSAQTNDHSNQDVEPWCITSSQWNSGALQIIWPFYD